MSKIDWIMGSNGYLHRIKDKKEQTNGVDDIILETEYDVLKTRLKNKYEAERKINNFISEWISQMGDDADRCESDFLEVISAIKRASHCD